MDNSKLPEFLSCAQVRAVDQFAIENVGIDGLVLMENAARGCVDLLERQQPKGGVIVVCGKGNNGGDGLAMIRHLLIRNVVAKIILVADPDELAGDALRNFEILNRIAPDLIESLASVPEEIQKQLADVNGTETEWIVDALLGTGAKGEIKEPFRSLIELVNESAAKIFSVDIPSGINGDTGEILGRAVHATVTATFVQKKTGFQYPRAMRHLGNLSVLDIGIPESVIQAAIDDLNSRV